jgi:hypothetical protein
MLKLTKLYTECAECDYRYEKGDVSGCVFPNHAPIDSCGVSPCNTGDYVDVPVDEDFVLIKNVKEVKML